MDSEADKLVYNATEVFTAIIHGYYYIRPGKNTIRFIKSINKVLIDGHKSVSRKHADMKEGVPFEVWLLGKMSSDMLAAARMMFDKEYYDSQVAKMVLHEKYDGNLLERYMYWLNEPELKSVFEGILTFKCNFDVFISDANFNAMMEELKKCAIGVIRDDPRHKKDYDEHIEYINNNWDFCFKYLWKDIIIETVCWYIDSDSILLAHMIKAFKYADAKTAAEYTGIAIWLMREFEQKVFDPKITDMSQFHLDEYDYRRSKVIHSNKSGRIMLA
jgi:hypothetical protein